MARLLPSTFRRFLEVAGLRSGGASIRAWLWALGSVLAFIACGSVARLAVDVVERATFTNGSFGPWHWLLVSSYFFAWGVFSLFSVTILLTLLFGRWPRISIGVWSLPIVGIILAVTLQFVLLQWAAGRMVLAGWEPLSNALVAISVAVFAALIAPREAAVPPRLVVLLVDAWAAFLAASNVRGYLGGISDDTRRLVALPLIALIYLVIVTWIVLTSGRPKPDRWSLSRAASH